MTEPSQNIDTAAVHAGAHSASPYGDLAPPIHLSTTFERAPDGGYPGGHIYSRNHNPNRSALEDALAVLEGGAASAAFASGMAAATAIFQALAPGDHVIIPADCYYGTRRVLEEHFTRWGLSFTAVEMERAEQVRAAMLPATRMIWIETPSNPLLRITDIAEVVGIAAEAGAVTVCDNTLATPVLQRPFELGVDLVLHATTKYLGGHSDVLGGAVVARVEDELFQRIRAMQIAGGAVCSPFDSWLLLRGMRTLPLRMRAHAENAMAVARYLLDASSVTRVHYPGLEDHPGHELARRQMRAFGGMLSFEVAGGAEGAMRAASRLELITRATSFGGVHSMIEHRASIQPGGGIPLGLLRLSVGIEHVDDIIADLRNALG